MSDRRTDERRAKVENLATDQVWAAVDENMGCGDMASQRDIERSLVRVAAQYVNRAAEGAASRGIELPLDVGPPRAECSCAR